MKVNIKTDPETLFLVHRIILEQNQIYPINRQCKVAKSMALELFELLSRRCIQYTSNPNGRKLRITLKYHLADFLYDVLKDLRFSYGGIYEANKLELFRNHLHQQLL